MSILERVDRWWDPGRPLREVLFEARGALPGDTPNPIINDTTDEFRLKHFDEFIEHTEYELALDTLIYIAEACTDDGKVVPLRFWTKALEAAEMMSLDDQTRSCRAEIDRAEKPHQA
ncbi:MAG: hypothetical protein AAF657_31260 [Acidobacteriota bacterium]